MHMCRIVVVDEGICKPHGKKYKLDGIARNYGHTGVHLALCHCAYIPIELLSTNKIIHYRKKQHF